MNINGIVSSENSFQQYNVVPFDRLKDEEDLLAVLWMDLDTTVGKGNGRVFYRATNSRPLLDEADSRIHTAFETKRYFKAVELLIITWDRVSYKDHQTWVSTG